MIVFAQGESRIVPVPLTDNGVAADLSTGVSQIICVLAVKPQPNGSETEVRRYALNPESDHGVLVQNVGNDGIEVQVEGSQSKDFPIGIVNAYVTVQFTDASFASGIREEKYDAQVGRIYAGKFLDSTP